MLNLVRSGAFLSSVGQLRSPLVQQNNPLMSGMAPTIITYRALSQVASSMHRRVVVTGMGLVTCLGVGVNHVWQRILQGHSGIQKLTDPAFSELPSRVAGLVPRGAGPGELEMERFVSKAEQRDLSMSTSYALVAAHEARTQARWTPTTDLDQERTGVAVGTGMADMECIINNAEALEHSHRRVSPYFVPKILTNMAAGQISLKYNLKGPNHSVSTACATGVHAIGDASRFIRHGDADIMICGGTDACVLPLAIAGFSRMRALTTSHNNTPETASRPFDKDRDGFVMSEGSGVLVMEEFSHAVDRGATIYGEILGYGLSGDAHHVTAPPEDGSGAYRAMRAAMTDAGVTPATVGYINAHATSTPQGDEAETSAICRLFGEHATGLHVSSTKGAVGHLLGAAGAVEAIFTILACHSSVRPPTVNCDNPDTAPQLDYITQGASPWSSSHRKVALCNSFGFGGTNASICVASMD